MPVPFGFSVGDCIAICILIKDTIKALDSAHGSASEYQAVIRELWALDRALLEVMSLQDNVGRGVGHSRELNALFVTVGRAVQQCKGSIEEFLKTIKSYDVSLGPPQVGLWRGVKGKVSWALLRKDDLNKFRAEVNAHSSAINMLLITASVSLSKLNGANIQEGTNKQLGILGQVKDIVDEQRRTLEDNNTAISRLAESVKYFFTLGIELKGLMARIWTLTFRSYDILLELQTRVPREFEPCWIQEPLMLTDALGRIAPVHLELINSWTVLESVLEARFQNIPGERKIRRREYALQERSSQRDIPRSSSFSSCFLPGSKVDMSMVFKEGYSDAHCPGCGKECCQGAAVNSRCANCGIWFQRIEEHIEHKFEESNIEQAPASVESRPVLASQIVPHSSSLRTPASRPATTKRTAEAAYLDEHISLFKRVRLLQPKHFYFSTATKVGSEYIQPMSTRSFVMCKRQRVFSWLDDNRRWEEANKIKREQKMPTYLLKTKSLLQLAAYNGDIESVQGFLSQRENVNTISVLAVDKQYSRYDCTALTAAIDRKHTNLIEYLLAAGSDPNMVIEHGHTPLVLAVRANSLEIAGLLLRHGADVLQISKYGPDALQRACYDGNLDMVNLLLSHGADVNGPSGNFGFGPALVAAAANDNIGIIQRLLACGANVNSFQYSTNPAHQDPQRRQNALVRAISNDFTSIVRTLLDAGADFNIECECGDALQNAAYFGRREIFDELVSRGADPYRETKSFANCLEAAVSGGQGRMFEKLLALGMDINVKSAWLNNLLQVASRSGKDSIVEYLLDQGMDVNAQGGFYWTALNAAVCHGNESTCRILIARGADILIQNPDHDHRSALHYAVEHSFPEIVRVLLDAGASINTISGEHGTVLQLASQNTSEDVVHILLERGADVNIQAGYLGNALQAWSYVGNREITELLLQKGANPNAVGGYYEAALIAAVHGGHQEIVELLIRSGADVEMETTSFGSPLECATFLMAQSSKWEEGEMYGKIVQFLKN